jgi:plasmid stability protein
MSDEPAYRALTLRMPPELHAAVRASAAAHERSWGGEVRVIVREHFNREVGQPNDLRDRRSALDVKPGADGTAGSDPWPRAAGRR